MFDSTAEYAFPARSGKTKVEVVMRWPSDEEWSERHRNRKFITRDLGRGVQETDVETEAADLKLYQAARLNGSPDLSKAEAALVVRHLEKAEVTDVTLDGEEATVTMTVAGGTVKHVVQIPTADQVMRMQRSAARIFQAPHNQRHTRIYLEPTAKLWDECKGTSGDYVGPVPAIHKDAAIRAVVEQINLEMSAHDDESFF